MADQENPLGPMPTDRFERLQSFADRLEHAWAEADNASVDLLKYLPPTSEVDWLVIVHELIKTDLGMRWKNGRGRLLEWYTQLMPRLAENGGLPADVVYEEFRTRQLYGDKPALESYRERFPQQFARLTELVRENSLPVSPRARTDLDTNATLRRASLEPSQPTDHDATDVSLSQGKVCGYSLGKVLGQGGFGKVWLAEAPGGVKVALKIIEASVEMSHRRSEGQALELIKNLRHPHLLSTHAYFTLPDRLVIVMELADGSLGGRLKDCKRSGLRGIPVEELLRYMQETADALDFLHANGVIHRDIKPENILLQVGHVKLADFGLARVIQENRKLSTVTTSGTPAYMPPELWRGKSHVNSDQYSLALTYAEMRLGRRIVDTGDFIEAMIQHNEQQPNLAPLPEGEQTVLLRALAKDPTARFPTCREFVDQLAAALGVRLDSAAHSTAVTRPSLQRRWRLAWIIIGLLLAVGLAVWGWTQVGRTSTPLLPPNSTVNWTLPSAQAELLPQGQPIEEDGRRYPERLVLRTSKGTELEFVLIPRVWGDGVKSQIPAFFIMRDKVSHRLFAEFAAADVPAGLRPRSDAWKTGGVRGPRPAPPDPEHPVMGVTVDDAYRFARWLGGDLPSVAQWIKAVGHDVTRLQEPLPNDWKPGEVAVRRNGQGPMRLREASLDVSQPFGLRDVFGNGWEWTRDVSQTGERVGANVTGASRGRLTPTDFIRILGQSFNEAEPLRLRDLTENDPTKPVGGVWEYGTSSPEISFRIVLDTW